MTKENNEIALLIAGDLAFRNSAETLAEMGVETLLNGKELVWVDKLMGNGALISSIIMHAIVSESALKALAIDRGEKLPKTHDLEKLFNGLPEVLQQDIKKKVKANCEGDFETLLKENKTPHENWIRFYRGGVNICESYAFIREFSKAINFHCADIVKKNFSNQAEMSYYLCGEMPGS